MADRYLLQLSDLHLTTGEMLFPGSRPRDNLVASLRLIADAGLKPDMVILTGDLANAGDPASYQDLSQLMATAVGAFGGRVVYLPGNHDDRSAFRRYLLNHGDSSPLVDASQPINQVHWVGGLRIVLLDSVVAGEDFGELGEETLAFLKDVLAVPAVEGTVLALHHPPIPSPVHEMTQIMLRNPVDLAEAIDGSDVRVILSGHNHHVGVGVLAAVPVWVSPSTAYTMDVLSRERVHGLPGCSLSQIELHESGMSLSAIPVPLEG